MIPVEDGTGENLIVVVPGANAVLTPEDVAVESVRRALVLLLQLEVPMPTVHGGGAGSDRHRRPHPRRPRSRCRPTCSNAWTCWCPTSTSSRSWPAPRPASGASATWWRSPARWPPCAVVVTLGARGALVVPADGGGPVLQPPPLVTPVDTTGAGDCFCGALGQALAGGASLTEAVRHAVAAAALSTTGPGARGALPDDAAVRALLPQVPDAVALP